MYSNEEINSAVASGALSAEAAASLRAHVAELRSMPVANEEQFRLVTSFNDIFVAIGVVIMLVAAGAIGQAIVGAFIPAPPFPNETLSEEALEAAWWVYMEQASYRSAWQWALGSALVAATAWGLAEFFTAKRRMALPSIILLLAFVGAIFAAIFNLGEGLLRDVPEWVGAIFISFAGLIAALGAWLHWRRFMVPITIAAGTAALAVTVIGLIAAGLYNTGFEDIENVMLGLTFVAGIGVFLFAMRWDTSDLQRTTRRSDVAFWLHLLAAPMIAHPVFYSLGVMDGGDAVGIGQALAVVAIYVLFGLVALAIDRRALLVSALAYVLVALGLLFDRFGAVELSFALTALVIGSALLSLSAFWTPIRSALVSNLPPRVQARLPESALEGSALTA
ncbi:hypothetical protein GRI38_06790 [Altererythrobacter aurantiacus]|uniref:DUF2157 domain-containing protein n=1 Tax=Parapontixanthobacter aurantiacus TaxID=1463599 RepID=A0A844ZFH5_9SPHN|nr:hypothetical protein [Parapontixanthobacter aurantiacus]MXO85737.1 hypothetical protein [Parapontixanthobacter aurantiacus]